MGGVSSALCPERVAKRAPTATDLELLLQLAHDGRGRPACLAPRLAEVCVEMITHIEHLSAGPACQPHKLTEAASNQNAPFLQV